MAPMGVEKASFRVVTQCLNQRRHCVPLSLSIYGVKFCNNSVPM